LIALWLLLQVPIEIGAANVYEEKKPEMIKVIETSVKTHELKMEPRWQAIEMRQETLEEQSTESLEILRKLDPDQ